MKIAEFLLQLDWLFPLSFALPGDPVGLQVGDPRDTLKAILLTIDGTQPAIAQAQKKKANLIVSYHAPIFAPLTSITTHSRTGAITMDAIRSGISIYVLHTILDVIPGGTNDELANRLGLMNRSPLTTTRIVPDFKLVVFVPKTHTEKVRQAICNAGAGVIGNYDQCSFQSEGKGTYRPLGGSKPFKGRTGKLEFAEEYRLEVVVPELRLSAVMQALRLSHPYEEVAYDLYQKVDGGTIYGIGRIGELSKSTTWPALQKRVTDQIAPACATVRPRTGTIRTVAVFAGSGKSAIAEASARGAHVLVTGELDHHARLEAEWRGLGVIEVGHAPSERPVLPILEKKIRTLFPKLRVFLL